MISFVERPRTTSDAARRCAGVSRQAAIRRETRFSTLAGVSVTTTFDVESGPNRDRPNETCARPEGLTR